MRSVFVHAGRFTWRLRRRSCCRRRAFSAPSSDLLRLKSARVESGKEEVSGFVQRVKREERACKQPSFSCCREVITPVIEEGSPSWKSIVVRAGGCCRRLLIVHQPSCVCKQARKEIFLGLEGLVFERMIHVANTTSILTAGLYSKFLSIPKITPSGQDWPHFCNTTGFLELTPSYPPLISLLLHSTLIRTYQSRPQVPGQA